MTSTLINLQGQQDNHTDTVNLIMMVGLPGSGKSTYALDYFPYHVYVSSDTIIEGVASAMNKSYTEIFNDVIDAANLMAQAELSLASFAGENIVIDRTNLTKKSRAKNLSLLKYSVPYKTTAIVMDVPLELLKLRLTKRNESGKIIPDEVMETFVSSFEMPTLDEGFDEIKVIKV